MTTKPKIVIKTWGREIWFANNSEKDYCGKILEINPGDSVSFHFHLIKDEVFYLLDGDCELCFSEKNGDKHYFELAEGDSFHVPAGVCHSMSSVNGCRIVEVSTFHRDEDSYRVPK